MMKQVRWYSTIGWFGEDGIEALHPHDSRKRQLVQAIRNLEARHRAHSRLAAHRGPVHRQARA